MIKQHPNFVIGIPELLIIKESGSGTTYNDLGTEEWLYLVTLAVFMSLRQMAHTSLKSWISDSDASLNILIRTDSESSVA